MLASPRFAFWLVLLSAGLARAQPPEGPPTHVETRALALEGGGTARLVSTWAATEEASGLVLSLGASPPVTLVRGSAPGSIEVGAGVVLVAYQVGGTDHPFRARIARREGSPYVLGAERELARPGARTGDYPFAVVIAPLADGFAVFFEEVQSDDPTAARTYLFHLDREGAPLDAGREIPIPWPLAAALSDGHGFHLALYYPGGGGGMRLSMVALTADGQPQGHPDWSSAAGFVSDVHLVHAGDHILAFYRGGAAGDRLLESDVTAMRGWGSEPPRARDHGALAEDAAICISAEGEPTRVRADP
jgi:hypothetical protein